MTVVRRTDNQDASSFKYSPSLIGVLIKVSISLREKEKKTGRMIMVRQTDNHINKNRYMLYKTETNFHKKYYAIMA